MSGRDKTTGDVPRGTDLDQPSEPQFDVIIVGQGLAGTALAWQLHWLGQRVLIADRDEEWTSSKVAAGLITPITGKKLIRSWRFAELWPVAVEYYRRIESIVDEEFFHANSMVRLFEDDLEGDLFRRRLDTNQYRGIEVSSLPEDLPAAINIRHGGFQMAPCGRLDAARYLATSRHYFQQLGQLRTADLDVSRGTILEANGVYLPTLGVTAKRLVFCQGFEAMSNPWFRDVEFKPAKGEVLCVRNGEFDESRILHRGVWLVPQGAGMFRVGSTYDWSHLDVQPTEAGRNEILSKLADLTHQPFEFVNHLAGVRPIHRNQFPIVGCHPTRSQLGFFNGLGSKGSLHAPYFARQLARHLVLGEPIEPIVDLNRRTKWKNSEGLRDADGTVAEFHVKRPELRPLTAQAQAAIKATVRDGDWAIDATAGNGYDTQFLAELVGTSGRVFAFDIQELAINNTRCRLEDAALGNVELIHGDHSQMGLRLPSEAVGKISAVMFNLGYLPGGDKQLTTQPPSTHEAITQAIALLKPDGVMTILAYTGHDGGASEAASVAEILNAFDSTLIEVTTIESPPGKRPGPRMFHVKRSRNSHAT